jgi:hypothetical protein
MSSCGLLRQRRNSGANRFRWIAGATIHGFRQAGQDDHGIRRDFCASFLGGGCYYELAQPLLENLRQ